MLRGVISCLAVAQLPSNCDRQLGTTCTSSYHPSLTLFTLRNRSASVQVINKLLYRSQQRGFLELDLLVGLWAQKEVPAFSDEALAQFEHVLNLVRVAPFHTDFFAPFRRSMSPDTFPAGTKPSAMFALMCRRPGEVPAVAQPMPSPHVAGNSSILAPNTLATWCRLNAGEPRSVQMADGPGGTAARGGRQRRLCVAQVPRGQAPGGLPQRAHHSQAGGCVGEGVGGQCQGAGEAGAARH